MHRIWVRITVKGDGSAGMTAHMPTVGHPPFENKRVSFSDAHDIAVRLGRIRVLPDLRLYIATLPPRPRPHGFSCIPDADVAAMPFIYNSAFRHSGQVNMPLNEEMRPTYIYGPVMLAALTVVPGPVRPSAMRCGGGQYIGEAAYTQPPG